MKFLPTLLFPVLLCTCASASVGDPPVDLNALAPILTDLQLAESLTNEVPVVLRDSMREVYYDNVLSDHQTTRAEFDSLMWIVRQEPVWVDSLYTQVGEMLSVRAVEE
ncbi:DUF4296 domain-containing protein [Neolewinella antarctica]|uniref:DUF4296 domain-containing protein n=1 Tax=Neolewinella antarctica TaxID=442734 RepID=A0ABX0X8Q9_9BACT|nr:DUF4296 domain-containing protein [Neolewinella antarctica]NJC25378.1 hypothetical protein [Neolewinella antarctica]